MGDAPRNEPHRLVAFAGIADIKAQYRGLEVLGYDAGARPCRSFPDIVQCVCVVLRPIWPPKIGLFCV